jgi:hypothetical protein
LRCQIEPLHRIAKRRFIGVECFMADMKAHQITENYRLLLCFATGNYWPP